MVVVVAAVAMLASISTPAIKTLFDSMATKGGAKAMISAGLATARAIAAKEQRYAGVRFQKAYNPAGPLEAEQYMIFIVHDFDGTKRAYGFRAVEGIEPIKLPDNIGVMDLRVYGNEITGNIDIDIDKQLIDTTAFSIVFSPSGKLVIHPVRTRNRDGESTPISMDEIFNTITNVTDPVNPVGMFIQDDGYLEFPTLDQEQSRNMFIIYDRELFKQAYDAHEAYSNYLYPMELRDEFIYINPYTGTIVSADR